MPLDIRRQRLVFQSKLLLVTLAENTLALLISSLDILVGVILRDSHKANALWQMVYNLVQMGFNVVIHDYCCSYSGLSLDLPYS